jgi:hypothetical protein
MPYVKLRVSNDTKYMVYHLVVFAMLIITCVKLHTTPIDGFTLYVLFVVLIQLWLFVCINTSNHYTDIPPCCYLVIAWTSVSTSLIFIPYVVITICALKDTTTDTSDVATTIDMIYLIGLCIYIPTVLGLINWYYLSSQKFSEMFCSCYSPTFAPVSITLPVVHIPYKSVVYRNSDCCTICVEPYDSTHKRVALECSHILCDICLTRVVNINNKCPFCKADIKG